ncbi:uncharacterized protein [Miscanthus floridulus]|uniref:uncharacterized protein n=1 Tax=Miscanthus floridulus TaxID=154761 RepID=UPI00345A411E
MAAAKVSMNLDSKAAVAVGEKDDKAAAADKVARKTKTVMVRKTIVDDLLSNPPEPLGDSLASSAAELGMDTEVFAKVDALFQKEHDFVMSIIRQCQKGYKVVYYLGFEMVLVEVDDDDDEFDLNLPLDDFGAVDFDYLQNLAADDDDGNLALDLNEAENDDGDAGFDLNEPEDDEHGIEQHADQVNQPKHDYSDHVRQQVYQALLMRSKNGKLGKQDTTIVGAQFGVKIRSVQRIWKQDLGFFSCYSSYSIQEECKNNARFNSSRAAGIYGVLSTEGKYDLCDTTNCFEGSNEDKGLQQNQDSSHE